MNAQLEQQIQADFPFMKLNKIDGEENLYRRWGCDCDDGWYNLIHDMCQAIADRYAEEGLPIDLIPTQLKEKFATLRFYYSFEGAQFRTYEAKSKTVCEKCGSTDSATIRRDFGWWRTLCKACYEKRMAARAPDRK